MSIRKVVEKLFEESRSGNPRHSPADRELHDIIDDVEWHEETENLPAVVEKHFDEPERGTDIEVRRNHGRRVIIMNFEAIHDGATLNVSRDAVNAIIAEFPNDDVVVNMRSVHDGTKLNYR